MSKKIGILLAAGKGSRMKSDIPKPLHKIENETMIFIILKKLFELNMEKIFIVVSPNSSNMIKEIKDEIEIKTDFDFNKICFIIQEKTLGTGHAVKSCIPELKKYVEYKVLIMFADIPLISKNSLQKFINQNNDCNLGVCIKKNPFGCGRIIMKDNFIIDSIEEKDCSDKQRLIKITNTGIYYLNCELILNYIDQITNNNAQKEYYLPDLLLILIKNNYKIEPIFIDNEDEILNVNTPEDLKKANKLIKIYHI